MQFNSEKFEVLRYKTNHSEQIQNDSSYQNDQGIEIEEKEHTKDLGIHMSSNATFSHHILEKCSAVKLKIAWVLRTFRSRDRLVMLTLWRTQVLHHLEYCSQLWAPSQTGSLQTIELLQNSFFKQIYGLRHMSYWDQLSALNCYSLERRRERYRIIYTWRILENQVPNLESTPIEIQSTIEDRLGRRCKIPAFSHSTRCAVQTIRESSFPIMGPRLFNALPKHLRNLKKHSPDVSKADLNERDLNKRSLEVFKAGLDQWLGTVPDQPLIPTLTDRRRIESNSVIDWVNSPYLREQDRQHTRVLGERSAVGLVTA